MDNNGRDEDRFGNRVAIYKDTVAIGARGFESDDVGEDSDFAYVFTRSGNEWKEQTKLLSPDGAYSDQFGSSVASYDNGIVLGSRWDDDGEENSGSAYVYTKVVDGESSTTRKHQAKLILPEAKEDDCFALTVFVYGETVIIRYMSEEAHVYSDYIEE